MYSVISDCVYMYVYMYVCMYVHVGCVAAKNMLGKEEGFRSIPYFWSVLTGKSVRYCG